MAPASGAVRVPVSRASQARMASPDAHINNNDERASRYEVGSTPNVTVSTMPSSQNGSGG